MSERPLNEWSTYPVNSVDETIEVRSRLLEKGSELAAFMNFEGHYYFNFVDANFIKTQNLDTREVVEFFDCTVSQKFMDEVLEELKQIQGL